MKRIIAILLCLLTLLSFAACNNEQPAETQPKETKPVDNYKYPTINDQLTWDKINAFPIKNENMTIQEMRQLCADFMIFSKTAMWIPNDTIDYIKNSSNDPDQMLKGQIYAGLPYCGQGGCGNVYRLMDFMNEENGVVDMVHFSQYPDLYGNHCSSCTYWAWGRVINSVGQAYTKDINHSHGFLRVGPYTYDDWKYSSFSNTATTTMICQENGLQTMFDSYAQLHLADGLVQYIPGGGHVLMVTGEPHVVYTADGQVDGVNSYLLFSEEGQRWGEYKNDAGDVAQMKNSVNTKMSFLKLYEHSYLPFTFAEFLGTDPIDPTECKINLSGDSVTVDQLFKAKVTANFGISDVYITAKNADGSEAYRCVVRAAAAGEQLLTLTDMGSNVFHWGDLAALKGEYTVEISAQLSTGERPVIYTGKLVA